MFNNCGTGVVPVMDVNGNNNNNDMWGNGCWWIWILWFAMMGWGNGGWGGYGNGGGYNASQFTDAALQRGFDNQFVIGKLDRLGDGLASLGYDQLNQINGVNSTIQQVGWNLQQTMNQNEMAQMQRDFAAQQQRADCCCENRVGQMNIVNQMDKNNCATNNLMQQLSQQQMWAYSQGMRDISDQIAAGFQRIENNQKDAQIAALTQQVNNCNLEKAVMAAANYTVDQVNPRTMPSYLTCNPNTGNVFPQSGIDQLAYQQWLANQRGGCCNQNQCCNNNGCCGF